MSDLIRELVTSPLPFATVLALLGFLLLHQHARMAITLWALALGLVLQSSAWLFDRLSEPLVGRAQQLSVNSGCLETYPVLVILGGGVASPTRLTAATAERVARAAEFLREKPKIVILSGGPTLGDRITTEATLGERDLRAQLPGGGQNLSIWREETSKTTHQNATGVEKLMTEKNLGRQIILVTGVFHMRRAAATFAREGFEVCALPSYPPSLKLGQEFSFGNTVWLAALVHEYLGYWYYQWRGWI